MKNSYYGYSKLKKNSFISLCLVFFTVFCVFTTGIASAKDREKVNISYYNNSSFYNVDSSMNLKGGDAFNLMASINRYLNWDLNYVYGNFNESLDNVKTGKTDLIFGVYKTPLREKNYVFNKEPIALVADYICARADEDYLNDDYTKLNGKRVGYIKDNESYKKFKTFLENRNIKVTYVMGNNSNELRNMLIDNKIDYFIINTNTVTNYEKSIQKISMQPLYIMATKDKRELIEKIDNSIRRLKIENPELMKDLLTKINDDKNLSISSMLDFSERRFIRNAKELRFGVVKNNAPYYYKDSNGNADGIIKVVIDKIQKESGLKFSLVPFDNIDEEMKALKENKIDAIGMVSDNLYNAQKFNLNLSQSYISSEAVILKSKTVRTDKSIDNLYAVKRSPFGHGNDFIDDLPNARFKEYETVQDCIDALNRGEVGAAIVVNFNAKMNNKELKNADDLVAYFANGLSFKHCIGFSNKIDVRYLEITDKIIKNFDSSGIKMEVINASNNSYAKTPFDLFFDKYKMPIITMLTLIIIVLVILYLQSLIMDRKMLKLGDERFKKASQQAQVSYWEYNYDEKKLTFFDDKWTKRHGLKKNVIENYDVEKRKDYFDEDTRNKILQAAASLEVENENELQIEARGVDGKMYYYLIKISAIRDDSKRLVKVLGSILDVTSAKNMLNRYEQEVKRNEVMGSMLLASFMVNLTKNELTANSDCIIAKKDELIGMNYDEFIETYLGLIETENQKESFREVYLRAKLLEAFNKGHSDFISSVRMNYGTKLNWIETAFHVTKDPFTNNIICIIYVRDAKERETLQSALDLAEAANDAKSNFLSSVSHEIRTPMNAIIGLTDMALEEVEKSKGTDSKIHDELSNIKLSSEYLLAIINDILEMSRIESGKTQLNKKIYDSHVLIKTVVTIISMRAREKNIEFSYNPDKNFKRYYIGDEVKIKKILINILGNAIKFTPNNGKVTYTSKIISDNGKRTMFKAVITDTGIGISKKFIQNIFEPFSRENGNDIEYLGTGLGMAISKNFIKMMDGDIKIESELGKGTTVTMTLAVENCDERDIATTKEEKSEVLKIEKPKVNRSFEGLKILLVEDNKLNAMIANHVLEKLGFKTEVATNGQIAIDMFNEKPKDYYFVILMDIRMPVLGGIEATKAIRKLAREDAKTVPIVAMTANAFDIDRRNSLEAGMNEHITKPIDKEKLAEILSMFKKN